MYGLKYALLIILLHNRQNAVVVFARVFDSLPDGWVDGCPGEVSEWLWTNFNRLEFEVVGFELELIDEILLEIEKETIAG